jgi:hypothetical protein
MTTAEREVLLALNLRLMQGEDSMVIQERGVLTAAVAAASGRPVKSAGALLSHMRDAHGWVASTHGDQVGWHLCAEGVAALKRERDAGRLS